MAVAGVAHDLKTPISVILGAVECVKEGMDDKDYLSLIAEKAVMLNNLALSLSETAKQEIQEQTIKEKVDSRKFLSMECERHRALAEARGVKYVCQRFPKVNLKIDKLQISRVIQNLVNNAVKFSHKGGTVKIKSRVRGKYLYVTVCDEGKGIEKKNLPYVFDKFYMEDKARNSGGSGLGLYVAKDIVERHGGMIFVKSKPKRGSKFTFTMPVEAQTTKKLTGRFDTMPGVQKFFITLFTGFAWCWLYRFIRYTETKCRSTLWGGFIAIVLLPFVWSLDIISVLFYGRMIFLTE